MCEYIYDIGCGRHILTYPCFAHCGVCAYTHQKQAESGRGADVRIGEWRIEDSKQVLNEMIEGRGWCPTRTREYERRHSQERSRWERYRDEMGERREG